MTDPTRYRYRDLKPGDAYYEAWRKCRKAENSGYPLIFVAWVLVPLLGEWSLPGGIVLGVFALLLTIRHLRVPRGLSTFPCPRCTERYFFKEDAVDILMNNRCLHCGLPKYAPDNPDKAQADS